MLVLNQNPIIATLNMGRIIGMCLIYGMDVSTNTTIQNIEGWRRIPLKLFLVVEGNLAILLCNLSTLPSSFVHYAGADATNVNELSTFFFLSKSPLW